MAATYAIIKKTQEQLGKYVQKPPLTEKLLSKPPFRFLHDVVTAVITSQGVLTGLYQDDEMHSENVKEKEAKIRYLEKLIDCLSFALGGPPLGAKPSKIVSGQEPGKTNELLQALARVAQRNIDTSSAVQKVLNGEKPGKKSSSRSSSKDGKNKENIGSNGGSRRSSVTSHGR